MAMSVTYATVNGRLMMENRGGVKTAYVSDTLGNLIQCRDASGNKTYEAWYWSYGEIRTSTGSNPSPWGFVGLLGYYTDALNYLYVRARYYRPNLTRWQTVDPLWPQQKAYMYATGDPVSDADPTGFGPTSVMGGHVGSCRVMVCRLYGFSGIGSWTPTHKFVCVTGPYGGCSGGLYPPDPPTDPWGGPGEVQSDTDWCTKGADGHRAYAGEPSISCDIISTDCTFASDVCECLRWYQRHPPEYIFPVATCYTFPTRNVLPCACSKLSTFWDRTTCLAKINFENE